jgi:hypothetical protein
MSGEPSGILEHVERISELDLDRVEATSQVIASPSRHRLASVAASRPRCYGRGEASVTAPGEKLASSAAARAHPRRALSLAALAACCGALLLLAPSASHAVRYASPIGGVGDPCTDVAPCEIHTAIESAPMGETVILKSTGADYNVGNDDISAGVNSMTIRGEPGQPRPTIVSNGVPITTLGIFGTNSLLEHVRIDATGSGALLMVEGSDGTIVRDVYLESDSHSVALIQSDSILERAEVRAMPPSAAGLDLRGGALLRDSFVWSSGIAGGVAVNTGSGISEVRNATIVAAGSSADGFRTNQTFGAPQNVSIVNTIIDAADRDIDLVDSGTGVISYTISNSNLNPAEVHDVPPDTVATLVPPNQDSTATPALLSNPLMGDFHQMAGSPTRDAGVVDASTGPTDFDGEPRCMGAAPDIGADELTETPCGPGSAAPPASTPGTTPLATLATPTVRKKKCKRKKRGARAAKRCKKKRK